MPREILYVDDQKIMSAALRDVIEFDTGRKVHYANGVSKAMNILKDPNLDIGLVLLDIMMPAGDMPDLLAKDPEGIRTGIDAIPLLRPLLKEGAAIWLVTVRKGQLSSEELHIAGVQERHIYPRPITDQPGFLRDIRQHLGITAQDH